MGFNPKANNISWKALENKKIIADGRFGKLEKATWVYFDADQKKVEESVVVKKHKRSSSKVDVLEERDRINTWDHQNLSRLVGVVQTGRPGSVPWLVLEYLNMGDLRSYLLTTRRTGGLNAVRMSKLAYEIAKGMDYLHSHGIIHGDLACRNIIVDDKLSQVKINDFGFYDEKTNAQYYMHYNQPSFPCPVRWQAPENLPMKLNRRGSMVEGNSLLSKDGDIWSYGCVLFEIWSRGEIPFARFDNYQVCEMLLHFKKPTHFLPLSIRDHVYQTMQSCWRYTPNHRPLFKTIMQHFTTHEDLSDDKIAGETKGKKKAQKKKRTNKKKGTKGEKKGEEQEVKKDEEGKDKETKEEEGTDKKEGDGETKETKVGESGPKEEKAEGPEPVVVKNKDDLGYASDGQTLIEST